MGVKVRERKPGQWWICIDHKGRRKAVKVGTKEAAEAKQIEIEKALDDGLRIRTTGEVTTLREYSEKWMFYVKGVRKRKPATIRDYRYMLDKFILPEFGSVPVDELQRDELKALCKRLLEKGYSETTVHHMVRVLAACLAEAKEDRLVTENIAALPGKFLNAPKPGEKADVLSEEEAHHLLTTTKESYPDLNPLVFTLLRTGLRKGELRGLQWGDLDTYSKFIVVRRAFSKKDCYPMPEWVFPAEKVTKLEDGQKIKRPMEDSAPNRLFNKCLAKAGIRHIRLHDTRHCVASWHLDKGTTLEETKRLLGHSTIKLTSDTYGHKVTNSNREMASRLDRKAESATYPQPVAVALSENASN